MAVKPTKARIELTRQFLDQYHALGRKHTTAEGWIALKFSCTIKEAKALIAALIAANARAFAKHRAADPNCTCPGCNEAGAAEEAATHDATTDPPRIVCPDCGADIQAAIKFDCRVDPMTGEIARDLTGGEVSLYCADDCGWDADHGDLASDTDWPRPIKAGELEPRDVDTERD